VNLYLYKNTVYSGESQHASGIEDVESSRLMRTARLIRSKSGSHRTKTADEVRLMPEQNELRRHETYTAQPLAGVLMAGLMTIRQITPHGVRYTLR